MSKAAMYELLRLNDDKFEKITKDLHYAEKNDLQREINKRIDILGAVPLG